MSTCPKCRGALHRSHRRGLTDYVRSWWGVVPYRCCECEERVYLSRVSLESKPKDLPAHDLIIKLDSEKPTARVVIQAETHDDLQQVIHSLNDALMHHEHKAGKNSHASQ